MKIKGKLIKKESIEYGIFDCSDEELYLNFKSHLYATRFIRILNLPLILNHNYFDLLETRNLNIHDLIKYFTKQLL